MSQLQTGIQKHELDTPCLVIDLERLDRNIQRMATVAASAGVRLRPHAKTHKLVEVAKRQLAAGSDGLTVAKLGEAELFSEHGIGNLFVAYPLWGESKLERLCRLAERDDVRVAADSVEVCERISAAAHARGVSIAIRIEVDTGFGRCGVQDADQARALAARISSLPGVRLVGVMSFAGQTYTSRERVADAVTADAERLVEVAESLGNAGFEVPEVSVGSTPSATRAGELRGITEIRPGTYVFSDREQVALGWGTLDDCALTAIATVVSRPTRTRAVLDAGTKTLSSDPAGHAAGAGAIVERPGWRLASLNEEHGMLELPAGDEAPIGTTVEIVPNHACGAINLHDWVAVVSDGVVRDWWQVEGRGRVR